MAQQGYRSKNIRQNVQNELNDMAGVNPKKGLASVVYDALQRVQTRIVEEAEITELSTTLDLESGTELYDIPAGVLYVLSITPPTVDGQVTSVYLEYYILGQQIGFVDATGQPVSEAVTVTMRYTGSPDYDTDCPSDTRDPIVDFRWDTALFYGAVAELSGEDKWWILFEKEFNRVKMIEKTIHQKSGDIAPTQEYDN